MSYRSCCATGFRWEGTTKGEEKTIKSLKAYVVGDQVAIAIVIFHDAFGWIMNNTRLLADHFAEEVGATVYVPDFFHGTGLPETALVISRDGDDFKVDHDQTFDLQSWAEKNTFAQHKDEIVDILEEIRKSHSKVGAVGYCWGGSALMELAGKSYNGLLDCVTIAHPGPFSSDIVADVATPIQILAPEKDFTFSQELKDVVQATIPTLGIEYDYQHFPRVPHGFACRCDTKDEIGAKSLERAKNATIYWMKSFLT